VCVCVCVRYHGVRERVCVCDLFVCVFFNCMFVPSRMCVCLCVRTSVRVCVCMCSFFVLFLAMLWGGYDW